MNEEKKLINIKKAAKETNRNWHISDNKKAINNNQFHKINISPIKQEKIYEKKKNKKEIGGSQNFDKKRRKCWNFSWKYLLLFIR